MKPTLVQQALLASVLEATAAKPGNVHPEASFEDLTYEDFVRSAVAAAPAFQNAVERGVGATVLDAVQRTREAVGRNTNLGIALILAPLAAVPAETPLQEGIGTVVSNLGVRDAEQVYEAIRLANPGGLGRVDIQDVVESPSVTLLEAMKLAADRDGIAAQYAADFSTIFAGVSRLTRFEPFGERWHEALVDLHVWLMAQFPDTLIARKCGPEVAAEAARHASSVLSAGGPHSPIGRSRVRYLDNWLRANGNQRNPGTTADLVAGCVFAALRDGLVESPPMPESALPYLESGART
ncbi:MAG TPA: triphosphoribosyl-dephospho-CoA synthase [Planctomycetaceae bacterium]|nr:triphosphoribosyl-dephospho-CoA synthase [Planctomycetaceae bacterium]